MLHEKEAEPKDRGNCQLIHTAAKGNVKGVPDLDKEVSVTRPSLQKLGAASKTAEEFREAQSGRSHSSPNTPLSVRGWGGPSTCKALRLPHLAGCAPLTLAPCSLAASVWLWHGGRGWVAAAVPLEADGSRYGGLSQKCPFNQSGTTCYCW